MVVKLVVLSPDLQAVAGSNLMPVDIVLMKCDDVLERLHNTSLNG